MYLEQLSKEFSQSRQLSKIEYQRNTIVYEFAHGLGLKLILGAQMQGASGNLTHHEFLSQ